MMVLISLCVVLNVLQLGSPSFTVADAESVPIGYMTEMTQELEIRSNRIERDQRDVKQMLLNIARVNTLDSFAMIHKHKFTDYRGNRKKYERF